MPYKKFSKLSLWVTCPKCKQVFGVSPETVKKYMERVAKQIKEKQQEDQAERKSQKKEV